MSGYLYGLDLSMSCSGVTVFDLETFLPVYIGSIPTKDKDTHGNRLKYIEDELIKIGKKYHPQVIAIERGFSRFNVSTQVSYRVHGVINKLFHKFPQIYYPPKTIKEAIHSGTATKKKVREVIEKVYPGVVFKNEDESDSFAIAITYLIKNGLITWDKPEINTKKRINKKKDTTKVEDEE